MGKFNLHQNNFSTGKIGKRLQGRTDLKDYFNGLDEMLNAYTLRQGGAAKRPGTQFLQILTPTAEARIIPFIESKEEFYIIILDPGQVVLADQIRIFKPTNYLLSEQSVEEVNDYLIAGGLTSGLTGKYHFAQSASVIFITHSSGTQKPIIIRRAPDIADDFQVEYSNEGYSNDFLGGTYGSDVLGSAYLPPNVSPTTLTPSAISGGAVTITASTGIFDAGHVGSQWKLTQGANTGTFKITVYNSPTSVIAFVNTNFASTAATDNWQEGAWSDFRGFPSSVTLFEQRAVWGGTKTHPDTLFASLAGNFFHLMERKLTQDVSTDTTGYNYFGDTTITDPWQYTLSSTQVNKIQWLNSAEALQIGTLGGEYIASGGDTILSNESVSIRRQTAYGGEDVVPVQINNDTLFVSRDGKRVRNFRFNRDNGSYISVNVNINNEEIVNQDISETDNFYNVKFKQMVYQQSRDVVWCITSRDELVGLTFDPDSGSLAWHSHSISGTDVKVKSITVIPSTDFNNDDLYMLVERTVNSSTVNYLERIAQDFDHITLVPPAAGPFPSIDVYDNPWYLDSAVIREALPGAGVSGNIVNTLSHMEGESVTVLGDGVDLGQFTVTGGQIDIGQPVTRAIVGLQYKVKMIPVKLEAGKQLESAQGLTKRADTSYIRLYKTNELTLKDIRGDRPQVIKFNSNELFTGDKKVTVPSNPDDGGQFIIEQESPYPLVILSITYRGVTYDR